MQLKDVLLSSEKGPDRTEQELARAIYNTDRDIQANVNDECAAALSMLARLNVEARAGQPIPLDIAALVTSHAQGT